MQCESESERECGDRETAPVSVWCVKEAQSPPSSPPRRLFQLVKCAANSTKSPGPFRQSAGPETTGQSDSANPRPFRCRRIGQNPVTSFQVTCIGSFLHTTRLHLPACMLPRCVSRRLHHTKSRFLLLCLLLIIYPVCLPSSPSPPSPSTTPTCNVMLSHHHHSAWSALSSALS